MPILMFMPLSSEVREMRDPLPYAVQDVRRAVVDFVNAANSASHVDTVRHIQTVITELTRELEAASMVARHREATFKE